MFRFSLRALLQKGSCKGAIGVQKRGPHGSTRSLKRSTRVLYCMGFAIRLCKTPLQFLLFLLHLPKPYMQYLSMPSYRLQISRHRRVSSRIQSLTFRPW